LKETGKNRTIYSGSILVLGIVQLVESIAFTIPLSYFPNYAISLGSSVASIGLFTSSFMLSMALFSSKLGSLSDRLGRKKIILWGLFGDILFGIITGLAPNWILLLLIRILNGAVTAAAILPGEALLIDLVDEEKRGEASGFIVAMSMIGRSIGPAFGGFVQHYVVSFGFSILDSYRIPFYVDSILALLALILVRYKIIEPIHHEKQNGINFKEKSVKKMSISKLSLSIKIVLFASFISGISVGFIMPISVLFYNDKFGIEPITIGTIITLTGLIGIGVSFFAGRLSDKIGRKPLIAIGGISARISTIILPLTRNINQATLIMSVRGIGFNLFMPAMRALRADIVSPKVRGKIFGLFAAAWTSGNIVGPIIGTWVYSLFRFETINIIGFVFPGYGVTFLIYSIIGILSTMILVLFVDKK
jgi:DHA1 family multidrug resistance protein-like MFS transporter